MRINFYEYQQIIKKNKYKILFSLLFLAAAVVIYGLCGDFVSDHTWSAVQDMILDHFGPYDLSFIFLYLFAIVVAVYILYPLIYHPDEFSYTLSILSIFIITRSLFMLFTHLGAPSDAIIVNASGPLSILTFSNDLFFSGHTGLPFLGYLIFRKKHKGIGYFMLASSIILGITVLLMHVHYSIDVFAAFFITYGIYRFGERFFK